MKHFSQKKSVLFTLLASAALFSCKESKFPGYEETESGAFYKEYVNGNDTTKPRNGDILTVKLFQKTQRDSVLFDSRKSPNPLLIRVEPSTYKGDFFEMLSMMNLGDSSSFMIRVDSFFVKFQKSKIPKFLDSTGYLIFDIKLDSIKPKVIADVEMKKMEEERKKQYDEMMVQVQKAKEEEPALIEKYIQDNKIKTKPTASGLYYIEKEKGKGDNIKVGQVVTMKYTGKFFDGEVFDASDKHPEAFSFQVGSQQVIPGWDEAIQLMKPGGKAMLILPSSIAYGDGGGRFKPFASLVFDVEVVDVK